MRERKIIAEKTRLKLVRFRVEVGRKLSVTPETYLCDVIFAYDTVLYGIDIYIPNRARRTAALGLNIVGTAECLHVYPKESDEQQRAF